LRRRRWETRGRGPATPSRRRGNIGGGGGRSGRFGCDRSGGRNCLCWALGIFLELIKKLIETREVTLTPSESIRCYADEVTSGGR
jgi:hypothetical protein